MSTVYCIRYSLPVISTRMTVENRTTLNGARYLDAPTLIVVIVVSQWSHVRIGDAVITRDYQHKLPTEIVRILRS